MRIIYTLCAAFCTLTATPFVRESTLFAHALQELSWALSPCTVMAQSSVITPHGTIPGIFVLSRAPNVSSAESIYHALADARLIIQMLTAATLADAQKIAETRPAAAKALRAEMLGELGLSPQYAKPLTDEMITLFCEKDPLLINAQIVHLPLCPAEQLRKTTPISVVLIDDGGIWSSAVSMPRKSCTIVAPTRDVTSAIETFLRTIS